MPMIYLLKANKASKTSYINLLVP